MGSMNKRNVGSDYEERAAEFLKRQGHIILASNFNSRTGEIDLVSKDGAYYVFVEVKYRSNSKRGLPEESIGYQKIKRITRTARLYLLRNGLSEYTPCRFDVIVILGEELRWIPNAFDAMDGRR